MSKMSQLHAELSERAHELGFESIEEAEANGYTIDYTERRLVRHECCDMAKEQERAHLAYIVERAEHEKKLKVISEFLRKNNAEGYAEDIDNAIEFFNQGER